MTALLAVKAMSARGPAFNHSLLRAGRTVPRTLRGPVVGRHLCSAMHRHNSKGALHQRLFKGKSALQDVFPLAQHEGKGFRTPVDASTTGWMW